MLSLSVYAIDWATPLAVARAGFILVCGSVPDEFREAGNASLVPNVIRDNILRSNVSESSGRDAEKRCWRRAVCLHCSEGAESHSEGGLCVWGWVASPARGSKAEKVMYRTESSCGEVLANLVETWLFQPQA